MKRLASIVLTLILSSFLPAVSTMAEELPAPDGKALWTYMTKTSPYVGWGYWPGRYGMYEGTEPHGAHLKVFANGPALRAAREGKPMPAGAIVVKENYGMDGKTLMAVTPMYKMNGYNPEGGDWFWAKYNADGSIDKEGKVGGCIKCHEAVKDQNWIFNKAE
ncbi:MAG: cytochrome P460 family protein [Deferrisomatales bacterium]|nr:cytochrome P460 family protein [Deferrisomatales bacterium]